MKIKLIYLTTVDIGDKSAQSLQTVEMSDAFSQLVDFQLFAFGNEAKLEFNAVVNPMLALNKAKRSMFLIHQALKHSKKGNLIYTRDFYISLVLSILGYQCVWECHQEPSGKVKKLISMLSHVNISLRVLSISKALMVSGHFSYPKERLFYYHDCANAKREVSVPVPPNDLKLFESYAARVKAVYTGALHKGDDVDSLEPLFQAFSDWKFFIYGGRTTDEIESYKSKFSMYPNVHFLGRRTKEEVLQIQKNADLLLYPLTPSNKLYLYTSPLKLFEYMSTGKPILASRIGSIVEIISEDNAFCYSNDIVSAAKKFSFSSTEELVRKSQVNMGLIKSEYNWQARAQYILENCFKY